MSILRLVRPPGETELSIPLITLAQTKHLIRTIKTSGSTGYDDLSSKTIKKIGDLIAPQIMHMINTIIRTATFPQCFKVTKIIPILKAGKPADKIDSYRPVNCLPTLEKLTESCLLRAITGWTDSANHISHNHHGGRQNFSTGTAKLEIDKSIYNNIDLRCHSAVLATDLSAAFDCIDILTLLRKLEHHGIRGQELKLMESFLTNRLQFVEIDTVR